MKIAEIALNEAAMVGSGKIILLHRVIKDLVAYFNFYGQKFECRFIIIFRWDQMRHQYPTQQINTQPEGKNAK